MKKLGLFGNGGLLWHVRGTWEYQDRYGFERFSFGKCVRDWVSIPVNRDLTWLGKILVVLSGRTQGALKTP